LDSCGYDDSAWPKAANLSEGKLKGTAWGIDWALVPSSLPAREMTYQRLIKLRGAIGVNVPPTFPEKKTAITIPRKYYSYFIARSNF
jgi:alpha-L-rhamnosidase